MTKASSRFEHYLPRHSLVTFHRACILPSLDYGNVIYDNCTVADTNFLESGLTVVAAVKHINGSLTTISHENIFNDLGLTPLHLRRQFRILIAFRNKLFGPCPSFLSALALEFFKHLSKYSSRRLISLYSCLRVNFSLFIIHKSPNFYTLLCLLEGHTNSALSI